MAERPSQSQPAVARARRGGGAALDTDGLAGRTLVPLAEGSVEIHLDFAGRSRVVEVAVATGVASPSDDQLDAVADLLGLATADPLRPPASGSGPAGGVPGAMLVHAGAGLDQLGRPRGGGVPLLARIGVLRAELEERPLDDLTRGVTLLELAVALTSLPVGLGSGPSAELLAATGADLLRAAERGWVLSDLRPGSADVVADLITVASGLLDRHRARSLDGLARRLADDTGSMALVARAAPVHAMPSAVGRDVESAPGGPPFPLLVDPATEVEVVAATRERHHVSVVVRGRDGTASPWLRLSSGADESPVPLAVVPFRANRFRSQQARALAPPGPVTAEVVVRPSSPSLAGPWGRAIAAVSAGRHAVRGLRAGEPDGAERWGACADAWSDAGDVVRAETAAQLALDGGRGLGRPDPVVADRLRR